MSTISIQIDDSLKKKLQELTSSLGMDVTTFFTMAATQAVREQRLPFTPGMQPFNAESMQAKWEAEFMKAHPELPWRTYRSADELFGEVFDENEV